MAGPLASALAGAAPSVTQRDGSDGEVDGCSGGTKDGREGF